MLALMKSLSLFVLVLPTMIHYLAILPVMLIGALGRRVAGGVLNQWFSPSGGRVMGDVPARALWGLALAIAAILGGMIAWHALVLIVAVTLGCAVPMWAIDPISKQADGNPYPSPVWLRCLGLEAHGFLSMLAVTVAAWWAGYLWPFFLAGSLTILPAYVIGWMVSKPWFPPGLRLGSEFGEALWGALMALSVFLGS